MYSTRVLYNTVINSTFRTNHNLNVKNEHYTIKCFCTFRTSPSSELIGKMTSFVSKVFGKNREFLDVLLKHLQLTGKIKDHSTIIIKAWTRQCEYVAAQRFRRTQQMFCLYTRLWEERALKELLRKMRQQVTRRGKEFVFGAVGVSAFNWETDKISDEELNKHLDEFDYVTRLTTGTVLCKKCQCRRLVDIMLPDETYCKCDGAKVYNEYIVDDWEPYLERKNLLVWKRKRNNNFEYKLHGTFDDVTALDYLQVQVDTEFRKVWDNTAVQLYIVDKDEASNSDIIYWEMQWPRMFSNRDYVFNRRYMVHEDKKICVIISKSAAHPNCPNNPNKQRVTDYESCMVIRPTEELDKPGIEFSLTYYDDPGVNIPAAVCSWVAIAGMPDFLNKLRVAAKQYHEMHKNPPTGGGSGDDLTNVSGDGLNIKDININEETPQKVSTSDSEETEVIPPPKNETAENEQESVQQMTAEAESKTYWRYTHPYYYFG